MVNKIIRIVFNADLRAGHNGLSLAAKKLGVDVATLGQGDFVVFVNSRKSGVKVFASGGTMLGYYKSPRGTINIKTLRLIPKYFNGGQFHYGAALDEVIKAHVRVK